MMKALPSDNPPASPSAAATKQLDIDTITPQASALKLDQLAQNPPNSPITTPSRARGDSRATRPVSMAQTYQAPQVEVANDTPPELQPIFSFLNSHSNKLYQEGYFLKLHDLDARGRPSPDRVWNECFAQLVGTVLSLWDAAALDAAGEDGEVVPTFVNLSDASLKMIESLPMNGAQGGNLQNVLSISTAANNRYLLHFNSLNSLTQWTAGIRLAMFEHSTLQEAYTGSLIAGKGRFLNNIKVIMERSKYAHEDWARVRFGAGTPWKRCWCVIAPPDEKDYQKAQKLMKKTSVYERAKVPKGDIKFYDTRKVTKKTKPIATITDAYAAYAIYPQSKPLIDQSTLVKLEGLVTVHASPETTTEGFVFVMPEVHAAVSGFEMMLQWLFPVFDTFGLYGRPNRLIADTLDQRGLMFALPRDRRYGYLDILDVSALIHTKGSQVWSERQWRRELKKLTGTRMTSQMEESPRNSRQIGQRRNTTASRTFSPSARGNALGGVRFDDATSVHSSPGSRSGSPVPFVGTENGRFGLPKRTDSAPPASHMSPHKRSVSDAQGYNKYATESPSRLSYDNTRPVNNETAPPPPRHAGALGGAYGRPPGPGSLERIQSGTEVPTTRSTFNEVQTQTAASTSLMPPAPVVSPPAFTHSPNSRPANQPYQAPELRRAHSNVDAATLYQMQDATRQRDETPEDEGGSDGEMQQRQHNPVITNTIANRSIGARADRSQGVLNGTPTEKQRDLRRRLSTIEASPYVGSDADAGQFQSPEAANPLAQFGRAGSVQSDKAPGQFERVESLPPVPLHASRSIARKPLPKSIDDVEVPSELHSHSEVRARPSHEDLNAPDSPTGNFTWQEALIDQDDLERILVDDPSRKSTMQSHSSMTQDKAGNLPLEHSETKSVDRPRAGSFGTVGDSDNPTADAQPGDTPGVDTGSKQQAAQPSDMPAVDFGPTWGWRAITPGTVGDERRRSRATPSSGGIGPTGAGASPSETPGDRRSIAWQPASSAPVAVPGNRQSLTPEQWVQYRAAQAALPQQAPPRKAVPLYAHQRTASGQSVNQLRKGMTKTPPPLSRTPSGDWTQHTPQQRTPPSRPQSRGAGTYFSQPAPLTRSNSRGANAYLGQPSPGGMLYNAQPTNLTAKEQMHVARATGTPLISYTTSADKKQQEQHQPGLFGALAAREREKAEVKKTGRNSMGSAMIQQAIAQRQHQQMDAEAQAYAQGQYQMQLQMQQQAAQYAHRQQMQQTQQMQQAQQMQWDKMMLAQNQAPTNQGPRHQRPAQLPTQGSWLQQSQYAGQPQQQQQYTGQPEQQQQYAGQPQQQQQYTGQPQQQQQYAGQPQQGLAQLTWEERQALMQQPSPQTPGGQFGQQWHPQRRG
ncbi:hypothetical protein LTR08_001145 [Meristemomyces frigidus]|nr:hypothetical protein LTR08_001145 [Meristemomyces frigidus]